MMGRAGIGKRKKGMREEVERCYKERRQRDDRWEKGK